MHLLLVGYKTPLHDIPVFETLRPRFGVLGSGSAIPEHAGIREFLERIPKIHRLVQNIELLAAGKHETLPKRLFIINYLN